MIPHVLVEYCGNGSLLELLLGRRAVQKKADVRFGNRKDDEDAVGYAIIDETNAMIKRSQQEVLMPDQMLDLALQLARGMQALAKQKVGMLSRF